jgi:hypothetical protein
MAYGLALSQNYLVINLSPSFTYLTPLLPQPNMYVTDVTFVYNSVADPDPAPF